MWSGDEQKNEDEEKIKGNNSIVLFAAKSK